MEMEPDTTHSSCKCYNCTNEAFKYPVDYFVGSDLENQNKYYT